MKTPVSRSSCCRRKTSNAWSNSEVSLIFRSMSVNTNDSCEDDWIHRFCTKLGNDFFCEVDKDFIQDFSNLVGLEDEITSFSQLLDVILDKPGIFQDGAGRFINGSHQFTSCTDKGKGKAVEKLYGLIHARFLLTERGCKKMLYKYLQGHFGHCPRVYCENANVLPIGLSDRVGDGTVKLYCPRCSDVYVPKQLKHTFIDGAYFGSSFPHMLFMAFSEYRPPASREKYVPRLCGFKIHPSAYEVATKCRTPYTRVNGTSKIPRKVTVSTKKSKLL